MIRLQDTSYWNLPAEQIQEMMERIQIIAGEYGFDVSEYGARDVMVLDHALDEGEYESIDELADAMELALDEDDYAEFDPNEA